MERTPYMTKILRRILPRIGAHLLVEPEYECVGVITFKNGKRAFYKGALLNINPVASVEICRDKGYTTYFLRAAGFSAPENMTFFSERLNQLVRPARDMVTAARFAADLGYPVIVKPNDMSQGNLVSLAFDESELMCACRSIFGRTDVALVERYYESSDFRIVVLDGEVISAYQRKPLSVAGDGRSTIYELLVQKQRRFEAEGRTTRLKLDDTRITANLERAALSYETVLARGQQLKLLEVSNLSAGGAALDLTESIHPSFSQLAISITSAMNLRLSGVDILAPNITSPCDEYIALEVNGSPGLDNYAKLGLDQQSRVDALYLRILQAIEMQ